MTVDNTAPCLWRNHIDSAIKERPGTCLQHATGPDHATLDLEGLLMAHEAHNAPSACAQQFIDPLVLQTRFINEAADLERRLAIRKLLRPARSTAAKMGWENRRA